MKFLWLIGGISLIGIQFYVTDGFEEINRINLYWILCYSIIGVVFIIEGMSSQPPIEKIEKKISDLKKEIREINFVEQPTSQPNKTGLACPQCKQTLRVPSSYTGLVRCPSCKTTFIAEETHHSE